WAFLDRLKQLRALAESLAGEVERLERVLDGVVTSLDELIVEVLRRMHTEGALRPQLLDRGLRIVRPARERVPDECIFLQLERLVLDPQLLQIPERLLFLPLREVR